MDSLARTFTCKISQYSPDGYGRDSYIIHNNGGIYKKSNFPSILEKSPIKREYSPPQPRFNAKFTTYRSDGTGRDAYINSAGLYYPYGSKPFYTTLRTWSPIKIHKNDDIFYRTQQVWNKKRNSTNQAQEELNRRLSVPKKREKIEKCSRGASPFLRIQNMA